MSDVQPQGTAVEERLRAALRARADLVTAAELRPERLPAPAARPLERLRRPVLTLLAAAVVAAACWYAMALPGRSRPMPAEPAGTPPSHSAPAPTAPAPTVPAPVNPVPAAPDVPTVSPTVGR
ncbi:hypothetical protein ACIQGZ_18950 [Streptomyces sp. NPDC092296]|uniref:hypothetical protein n=1 Tax=Streptomyces sp. NPDC092296 TaxID=3366012 RepID=UPI0037FEBB50